MNDLYLVLVLVLLCNIGIGLIRVMRGPTAADRMLAAEMFSTSTVAIVLLLATITGRGALVDVALVFALLAALTVVTFVSRAWAGANGRPDDPRQGGAKS